MPINENNGKLEFDPAKRIRAAVGEEESANIDAEALERLTQAALSNAVRNDISDEHKSENYTNDIIHSSTTSVNNMRLDGEAMVASRKDALRCSKEKIEALCAKKDIKTEIGSYVTGFSKKQDKSVNVSNAINVIGESVSGVVGNYITESDLQKNDAKKATFGIAAGSIIDVAGSLFTSSNNDIVSSVFDPNFITQAEGENINRTIRSEKVKYAAEHAVAGVIAPAAIKLVLKKVMPKSLEHNKVLDAATSYGALSTIGKGSLMVVRNVNNKKLYDKVTKSEILVKDGESSELYTDIAKLAVRKSIDGHMDQTLIPGIVGSVAGHGKINVKSVTSVAKKMINKPVTTSVTPTVKSVEKKEPASIKPADKKLA